MTLGKALASNVPVVFVRDNSRPQLSPLVVCEKGKEAEALDMMEKMGLIERLTPSNTVVGVKPFKPIRHPSDAEVLKYYGWDIITTAPFEIQHPDGSLASGNAAIRTIASLKEEWKQEQRDLQEQEE